MIPALGFEGQTVAVFGLGRSGLPAARALIAGGARPILWDDNPKPREAAAAEGFEVVDLAQTDWRALAGLVLSPGAPLTHPAPHWTAKLAYQAGTPVIGDVELFARTLARTPAAQRARVIAVTGTNGKSTTTALIGWVLRQAGLDVRVGGNIGVGVLSLPSPTADAVYVIEVSSYQLDLASSFAPDAAILLNITPDHLDRHGDMDGYAAAKAKIFASQGPGQTAVVGIDDAPSRVIIEELRARAEPPNLRPVSVLEAVESGVFVREGRLFDASLGPATEVCDLTQARSLPGRHNGQNAAAAYAAVRALGLGREAAVEGLLSFPGLAHRMETVASVGGVRFINDSKATNSDAARQALSSYPKVRWIAGGRAKAGGIEDLDDLFGRVACAYLIGEAAPAFAGMLEARAPYVVSGDLETAVAQAYADALAERRARGGEGEDIVLLSPAAASFDQFADFEQRGEAFRAAVTALAQREA